MSFGLLYCKVGRFTRRRRLGAAALGCGPISRLTSCCFPACTFFEQVISGYLKKSLPAKIVETEMNRTYDFVEQVILKGIVGLLMMAGSFLLFPQSSLAVPFLYVKEDTPFPQLRFQELSSGDMREFDGKRTRPLVLIFWGADIDTKRERAIRVLSAIQKARSFYRERRVELAAVFVQPDQVSHLDTILDKTQIDFPVYLDSEKESFEKLGLYVMPSILMVGADGIIYRALGYTSDLDEILQGEVKVMLHEKTREELKAELYPEIVEKTTLQRRARMDYNYALNLIRRQKIALALEKLDMALEKNPGFAPALAEKGCLLITWEDFQEAGELLDRSLELAPRSSRALSCKQQLEIKRGSAE